MCFCSWGLPPPPSRPPVCLLVFWEAIDKKASTGNRAERNTLKKHFDAEMFPYYCPKVDICRQQHVIGNQNVDGSLERESSNLTRKHYVFYNIPCWTFVPWDEAMFTPDRCLPLKQWSIALVNFLFWHFETQSRQGPALSQFRLSFRRQLSRSEQGLLPQICLHCCGK